jgi:hypothetical protein
VLSRFVEPEQVDIYGRLIPSKSSFLLLLNELPDEESENEFIKQNKEWVLRSLIKYHPENYFLIKPEVFTYHKSTIRVLEIEKRKVALTGMSFPEYIQSRVVVEWFQYLWGNNPLRNLQPIMRGQKLKEIPHGRLRLYPEYVAAVKIVEQVDELMYSSVTNSSEAQKLAKEYKKAMRKLVTEIDKKKPDYRKKHGAPKYPITCIYCGKYVSTNKGKTCEGCEKKANADRVKKTKEKKRSEDPNRWVMAKVGICKGENCESDKCQVNQDDLCRRCHRLKMLKMLPHSSWTSLGHRPDTQG